MFSVMISMRLLISKHIQNCINIKKPWKKSSGNPQNVRKI